MAKKKVTWNPERRAKFMATVAAKAEAKENAKRKATHNASGKRKRTRALAVRRPLLSWRGILIEV